MSPTVRHPCPGCRTTLITSPARRCGPCDQAFQRQRGTPTQRAYGSRWSRRAKAVLARDAYLCQLCLAKGKHVSATEADHIKRKVEGGSDDFDNLRAVCKPCNSGRR